MAVVLSLDAGTTSVRTVAVDESGTVVDSAQQEFPQYFPRPGWVEHDAEEIWEAASSTLSLVARRQAENGTPIAALGRCHRPAPTPSHRLAGSSHRVPMQGPGL